jgi:hypothetical protein
MSSITIHAGDFPKGKASLGFGVITFPWQPGDGFSAGNSVVLKNHLESVEIASEESVKRVGGTLGWGIAGATLLGPVGLLAGLLLGGKGKDVTFVAVFKDGKKMLATADAKTYTKLQAIVF